MSVNTKITMEAHMIMPLKKFNDGTVNWFLLEDVRENQKISVPPNEQPSVNAFNLIMAKKSESSFIKRNKE